MIDLGSWFNLLSVQTVSVCFCVCRELMPWYWRVWCLLSWPRGSLGPNSMAFFHRGDWNSLSLWVFKFAAMIERTVWMWNTVLTNAYESLSCKLQEKPNYILGKFPCIPCNFLYFSYINVSVLVMKIQTESSMFACRVENCPQMSWVSLVYLMRLLKRSPDFMEWECPATRSQSGCLAPWKSAWS